MGWTVFVQSHQLSCLSRMGSQSIKQHWLFPADKPLKNRLTADFFNSIPKCPGVYFLRGADGSPLYVGQSKNLRQRIQSYKNAHPNHSPRRILRLVSQVRSITWECCSTALEAVLREDELLRTLKPRFNRANIYPEGYRYLKMSSKGGTITLQEQSRMPASEAGYGAFKGGPHRVLAALGRVLFRIQMQKPHWWQLPTSLLRSTRKLRIVLGGSRGHFLGSELSETVEDYFAGTSNQLAEVLLEASVLLNGLSAFDTSFLINDLLEVDQFFTTNTQRNRKLCRMVNRRGCLVDALELNALLIRSRNQM